MLWTRRKAIAGCGGVLVWLTGSPARADAYPSQTIKLIVPYPAGGTTDLLGRMISDELQIGLGGTVIVENRPGAGTTIAAEQVARAAPDGYTLLLATSTTLAINKTLYRHLPYDPVKDFTPIALVAGVPFALIVNPQVPAKTLSEFIAYAKSKPGLTYGSAGNGSPQHLGAEMLKAAAGIEISHVAYRGSMQAMLDVIAGHISFMVMDLQPALPQIKEGKVRVLGVTTATRVDVAPEIPTLAEQGLKGFELAAWQGVVGPAGLPAADRRQSGRADQKAARQSRHPRQVQVDRAAVAAGLDTGQLCGLREDRSRPLGHHREGFGRRAGMTQAGRSF